MVNAGTHLIILLKKIALFVFNKIPDWTLIVQLGQQNYRWMGLCMKEAHTWKKKKKELNNYMKYIFLLKNTTIIRHLILQHCLLYNFIEPQVVFFFFSLEQVLVDIPLTARKRGFHEQWAYGHIMGNRKEGKILCIL